MALSLYLNLWGVGVGNNTKPKLCIKKRNYTKNITNNGLTGNCFSLYFSILYKISAASIFSFIKRENH